MARRLVKTESAGKGGGREDREKKQYQIGNLTDKRNQAGGREAEGGITELRATKQRADTR